MRIAGLADVRDSEPEETLPLLGDHVGLGLRLVPAHEAVAPSCRQDALEPPGGPAVALDRAFSEVRLQEDVRRACSAVEHEKHRTDGQYCC